MLQGYRKIALLLYAFLLVGSQLSADQSEYCGTPDRSQTELELLPYYGNNGILLDVLDQIRIQIESEPELQSAAEPGVAYRIPIHFWIYRRSDGTGGPTPEDIQFWVDRLNERHRLNGSPIRFYQKCGQNFIDDDSHLVVSDTEGFLLSAGTTGRKARGAVNVHVVQDVRNSGGVYNALTDSILVEWESHSSTIPHEVGHYLGLEHTHRAAHSPPPHSCFREPVSRTVAFSLFNACFRPKGPRCASTGDALCDTPADPDLSDHPPNGDCSYDQTVEDYRNDRYTPDTNNIMSYSLRVCRNNFSAGQVGGMLADLAFNGQRPQEWGANDRNAFDEFEPDNLQPLARPFVVGETQEHSFHWDYLGFQNGREVFQKCDEDWIRFDLGELTPIEIFTEEIAGQSRPNTILTLYDQDLNVLASNDDVAPNDGFSRIDEVLAPGRYFVHITNKSDFPHPDSRGHYRLTVRRCLNCCFNVVLSGVSNPITTSFNLGARASQWVDFVPRDLGVENAEFSFNGNRPLDFASPAFPVQPSLLTAHLCDGADLTFQNGGRLVVGDLDTENFQADVRIGDGSVVRLVSGGSGIVYGGSRVLVEAGGRLVLGPATLEIEPTARILVGAGGVLELESESDLAVLDTGRVTVLRGGKLVYHRRAGIRLQGDEAVLDLRGDVEIGSGAVFRFTYPGTPSGYVRFELPQSTCPGSSLACPNVHVKGPAHMLFVGSGREDKIIEIVGPVHPDETLLRLTVSRGRVEMAAGEIQIDDAQLLVNNVDFVGTGGLALEGAFSFIASKLLFDGTGIRAKGDGSGRRFTLTNSELRNVGLAVYTESLAVRLDNVRISNHVFGWLGVDLHGESEVVESVIEGGSQGEVGLDLLEGQQASVRLVRSQIRGHKVAGVQAGGDIEVAVQCGAVRENRRGFFIYNGARLDMSTLSQNGNVYASDNDLTIDLDDAGALLLDEGQNLLAPRVPKLEKFPSTVIRGTLRGPACPRPVLVARGNTWNQGIAFPGPGMVPGNVSVRSSRPQCIGVPVDVVDPQPAGLGQCPSEAPSLCSQFPFICHLDPPERVPIPMSPF